MIDKEDAQNHAFTIIDNHKALAQHTNTTIEKLKVLLPCVINSDNQLDVKALHDAIHLAQTTSNACGYELTFAGKGIARAQATEPTDKELHAETAQSKDFESTHNAVIRGDNLDVLKILQQNYYGKIKMIYIDPPYNTQSENFIYKDNFKQSDETLIAEYGLGEDTTDFLHNVYGTRSHSGWMSFMYPRLKLARDLLRNDGVIFISIDDNEQANLRIMCDEIFGEENFVVNAIWEKVKIRKNSAKWFSDSHDHILIYCKNKELWNRNLLPRDNTDNYKNPDNDPRGVWVATPIHANHQYNVDYKITKPNGVVLQKPKNRYWSFSEENFNKLVQENRIWWGENTSYPVKKTFLTEVQQGLVPKSIFYYDEVGGNPHGDKDLKNLFDNVKLFDNPKSTKLISTLCTICTNPNDTDIILDFFAGSGTTGDAVMRLNAEDGGNRKFILVQIDEQIHKKKNTEAHDFCTAQGLPPLISSICIERLNRAGEKIQKELAEKNGLFHEKPIDIGYKVFSLKDKPKLAENENGLFETENESSSIENTLINMLCATCKPLDTEITELIQDKLYKADDEIYLLGEVSAEELEPYKNSKINIDGWSDISLENWLNLNIGNKENISVVY